MINLLLKFKKMNKLAIKNGDVPVSCIIMKDNIIVASAYNKKNINHNPIDHAEIIAIKKAAKKLKTYNLSDCILYSTMMPCDMCKCVINEARIKNVKYILNKEKNINMTVKYEKMFVNDIDYFKKEIKSFFSNKR